MNGSDVDKIWPGTVRFVSMELKFIKSSYLSIRLFFFLSFL